MRCGELLADHSIQISRFSQGEPGLSEGYLDPKLCFPLFLEGNTGSSGSFDDKTENGRQTGRKFQGFDGLRSQIVGSMTTQVGGRQNCRGEG